MTLKLNPEPRMLADFAPLISCEMPELRSAPVELLKRYEVAISPPQRKCLWKPCGFVISGAYDWVPGQTEPDTSAQLYERLSAITRLTDELDYLHRAREQVSAALAAKVRRERLAITLNRDKFGQEERQKLAALMAALRPFVRSSKQAAHLCKTGKHLAEDLEELLALAPAKLTLKPLPEIETCRYRWNPYCQNSPARPAPSYREQTEKSATKTNNSDE